MLTQSVRRVQPGKRTSGIFAKPANLLDSELWLEQGLMGVRGLVFTELVKRVSAVRGQCQGSIDKTLCCCVQLFAILWTIAH